MAMPLSFELSGAAHCPFRCRRSRPFAAPLDGLLSADHGEMVSFFRGVSPRITTVAGDPDIGRISCGRRGAPAMGDGYGDVLRTIAGSAEPSPRRDGEDRGTRRRSSTQCSMASEFAVAIVPLAPL